MYVRSLTFRTEENMDIKGSVSWSYLEGKEDKSRKGILNCSTFRSGNGYMGKTGCDTWTKWKELKNELEGLIN